MIYVAVMEAHNKAQTLHRDVGLPNIVLYRPKEGVRRTGYLTNLELGCELSKIRPRDRRTLTVGPTFLASSGSPNQFTGDYRFYVDPNVAKEEPQALSRR